MASDRDENDGREGEDRSPALDPTEDLSVADRRAGGQKLSQVLSAADDAALERFRKRRLEQGDISVDQLRRLRSLLVLLVRMVDGDVPDGWERLEGALELLLGHEASEDRRDGTSVEAAADDEAEAASEAASSEVKGPQEPPRLDRPAPDLPTEHSLAEHSSTEHSPTAHSPTAHRSELEGPSPFAAASPPPPTASRPPLGTSPARRDGPGSRARSAASPWARHGPPPAAAARQAPVGPPVVDEEGTVVDMVIPTRPALPFEGSKAPSPSADADEPPTQRGATEFFGYGSLAHPLAMRVEDYARLCVARDRGTEPLERVEQQLEIHDIPTREAVDRMFQLLFAADPHAYASWEDHYRRIAAAADGASG